MRINIKMNAISLHAHTYIGLATFATLQTHNLINKLARTLATRTDCEICTPDVPRHDTRAQSDPSHILLQNSLHATAAAASATVRHHR